ncbi:14958_t:CDS:2 [Funneliformis geosporum]|uniref:14958_t:CDS:1 n=1 Tax=Funneliformis geosporum TaxID=1117311 RepID=A0A9W4SLY4_9GLOM|nr:14958_t:CDS:2 [Funneliformis geosporum]
MIIGLVALLVKAINEGKSRDLCHSILSNHLSSHNVTIEGIYAWLCENKITNLDHVFLMGYLNYSGFGTALDSGKAYNYFKQASSSHPISQYYLGKYYEYGLGVTIDKQLAFEFYNKSAKQHRGIVGKFALGSCYEKGVGTEKNDDMAFYWYNDAANNHHAIAQYHLGNFYRLGIIVKDYNKAFDYYSRSAKGECSLGILMLGYCYLYGFGTSIDKRMAFELYLKAANMKNNDAQYNVAVCFEDGIGTIKDSGNAMEWYKKSAENNNYRAKQILENLSGISLLEVGTQIVDTNPLTKQKIIEKWKLNHGLILDGCSIRQSEQSVFIVDGDRLCIDLYDGRPMVFTSVNNPNIPTNLFTINKINNDDIEKLKPSDLCVNFPVVEITYRTDLSDSFKNFTDEGNLHDLYGHVFAYKILVGGQIFIKDFNLASSIQRDILKLYLIWAYNSVKGDETSTFNNNSFGLNFLPRIETSNGLNLDTPKKLANWLNSLYQENIIDIISYDKLVSITQLKKGMLDENHENFEERCSGIANFEKKLSLEKWIGKIGNTEYVDIIRWIKDFHIFQGLIIQSDKVESSKKNAMNIVQVPQVNSIGNFYFEMINPTTKFEECLITNKIFTIKNTEPFPFIKIDDNEADYVDYFIHFIVKCELYEIIINKHHIEPSLEFRNAIDKALDEMKPFNALQNVYNEYGNFFPLRIVLGKSLKNIIITTYFETFQKINLKLPIKESLDPYLKKFNLSHFITQTGNILEEDELHNWISNVKNNDLEIVEYDKLISLYDILGPEQKKKIDIVTNNNNQENLKILMTGITDLKDLNNNNTENYKRIFIEPSLENESYEVYGSVVKKDIKVKDYFVKFGFYDVNGFSAMISPIEKPSIDINKCSVLWMIVGNPLKLSVFSPNNREIQVDRIKKSITLQPNKSIYGIETQFPLSHGYNILIGTHFSSTNYNIKLVDWSYNCINFNIIKTTENEPNLEGTDIISDGDTDSYEEENDNHGKDDNETIINIIDLDLYVCILRSDYGSSIKVDHGGTKYPLDLFGYTLTEENLKYKPYHAFNKLIDIQSFLDLTDLKMCILGITEIKAEDQEEIAKAAVPITKFYLLISEIGTAFDEIIDIETVAEHNKRTCAALLRVIYKVYMAALDLKVSKLNQEFFNKKNYLGLQILVNVIIPIKNFAREISQMKTLIKYIQAGNIEKSFNELCSDLNECINSLKFIKNKIHVEEVIKQFKTDQVDLNKYLEEMKIEDKENGDVKKIREEVSSMVVKVNVMNHTMERLTSVHVVTSEQDQMRIDQIFRVHKLNLSNYKETNDNYKPRQGVTKWVDVKGQEFAFKNISNAKDDKLRIQNQVTILKEFQNYQYIIKIFGLVNHANAFYLVTEWAEFGNLREFYTYRKDRFDSELKSRISLDIARGLNFLRSAEIVHRDVRSKNILITLDEKAKLANFKLSRSSGDDTLNHGVNLERVRYCAPELLDRTPDVKYDHKCEVYSFGILLWEIAETRIPYEQYNDILVISELIKKQKYREPFSENNGIPEEFKKLVHNAVNPEPNFRPKLADMVKVLGNCFKGHQDISLLNSFNSYPSTNQNLKLTKPKRSFGIDQDDKLPDFGSFGYMTLSEAEIQHKSKGDIVAAYKCFEAYSKLDQIKAKYWKAYYISKRYDGSHLSPKDRDKIAAGLFKEVADDDEANEIPEAKLRYGDCLYHGKGVQKNLPEALEYFVKAADNGLKVAMFNAGHLYYVGIAGKKDQQKAIHYMKLAVYHEYEPAIKFCRVNNIVL